MDEPLPEATFQQLQQDWEKTYALVVEPRLEPSDTLRGRVCREFRRKTMTVIEAKKIKTAQRPPHAPRIPSPYRGGDDKFPSRGRPASQDSSSILLGFAYIGLCLGVLSGNFMVRDSDGTDRRMMTLTAALDYADLALRQCMDFGGGQIAWLQQNDHLCRGKMASLVRRGQAACTALANVHRCQL